MRAPPAPPDRFSATAALRHAAEEAPRHPGNEWLRQHIEEIRADTAARLSVYAGAVDQSVNGYVALLEAGHPVDVQWLVEKLQGYEQASAKDVEGAKKAANAFLRWVGRGRPQILPAANDFAREVVARSIHAAEMERDARWRLMRARARFQPSEGEGQMRGAATDLDAFLAAID